MCSKTLVTVVRWVVLRERTSLKQPAQVLGSQDVWVSGPMLVDQNKRKAHKYGENVTSFWTIAFCSECYMHFGTGGLGTSAWAGVYATQVCFYTNVHICEHTRCRLCTYVYIYIHVCMHAYVYGFVCMCVFDIA